MLRLICFPNAGTFANDLKFIERGVDNAEAVVYEYAGRGTRTGEPPYGTFEEMIARISKELYDQYRDEPEFGIFGHCMGTWVAYEVCRVLEEQYGMRPRILIVSASVPPSEFDKRDKIFGSDEKFLAYMKSVDGIKKEIQESPVMLRMMLPLIRADAERLHRYVPEPLPEVSALRTPIGVMYSDRDKEIHPETIDDWRHYTRRYLGSEKLEGDHFYLFSSPEASVDAIKRLIDRRYLEDLEDIRDMIRMAAERYGEKPFVQYIQKELSNPSATEAEGEKKISKDSGSGDAKERIIRKSFAEYAWDVDAAGRYILESGAAGARIRKNASENTMETSTGGEWADENQEKRRMHIALIGDSSYRWIVLLNAVQISGNVIVPLDAKYTVREMRDVIRRSDSDWVIYQKKYEDRIREAVRGIDRPIRCSSMDEIAEALQAGELQKGDRMNITVPIRPASINEIAEALQAEEPQKGDRVNITDPIRSACMDQIAKMPDMQKPEDGDSAEWPVPVDPSEYSMLLYTSGTTGTSKGVMISQRNIIENVRCVSYQSGWNGGNTSWLSVLPNHHVFSISVEIYLSLMTGMTVSLSSLETMFEDAEKFGSRNLCGVPMILQYILTRLRILERRYPEKSRKEIKDMLFWSGFDSFGCSGAFLEESLRQQIEAYGITVTTGYGMTECTSHISADSFSGPRPGSVGKKLHDMDVKFRDGEILIRGAGVMHGYYKDPEATKAAFDDGWFRTGDLGYMDADQWIYITGRNKNLIILDNGENVSPEEIEQLLQRNLLVREVLVYGTRAGGTNVLKADIYPNYEYAEKMGIPDVEAGLRQIVRDVNEMLAEYKRIRGFQIREKEFEKTNSRKIRRYLYHAGAAAETV